MANLEPNNKLFSYFIVMGVSAKEGEVTYKNIHDGKIVPVFLDVYPPFPNDVPPQYLEKFETLGFYDGFKIYDENLQVLYYDQSSGEVTPEKNLPENLKDRASIREHIYSSVMTDGDSTRRYCSTLLFYEKYYLKRDQAFNKKEKGSTLMPKTSLQDLIKYPYTMNDFDLIFLPKSITLISSRPCFDTQRKLLRYMYKNLFAKKQEGSREIKIPKKWVEWLESIITKQKGDGDIDEIWQEWFSSQGYFSTKPNSNEETIVLKEPYLKEFYVSAIFSFMDLGKYPFEKVILKMNKEEKEKDEELTRFRDTHHQKGIDLPDFDYRYLFQKLSVESIIQIYKCLILERQIIIFANMPGDIPYITEALLGLMNPLKWCCMYVPFFPIFLWEHLHALFPYIVGIASEHKQFIGAHIDLTDKLVVDLDSNSIYTPDNVPDLPKPINDFLTTKLKELFSQVQTQTSTPISHEGTWAEVTLKIKHAFNIVQLGLINNYLPFFSLPEEFDPEIRYTAAEVFNSEAYYANVPQEDYNYINEMHNTMMFTNFLAETFDITHIYEPGRAEMPPGKSEEVLAFINQLRDLLTIKPELPQNNITASNSEVEGDGEAEPSPFMDMLHVKVLAKLDSVNSSQAKEAMKRYYNPIKVDLFPYLVKYYYQFLDPKRASANQNQIAPPPAAAKKAYHARHTSLASLVSVNTEDTKNLNMSCQNFKTLNKNKIVNLTRMFSKSPSASRRNMHHHNHKSFDMQGFMNNLSRGIQSMNPPESKLVENVNNGSLSARELSKKDEDEAKSVYEHNDIDDISRKSSTVIYPGESKPEIVKRVIQKLESDDFVLKPNPRRKSTMASKMTSSLKPKPAQINEADEIALEEAEKKAENIGTASQKQKYNGGEDS